MRTRFFVWYQVGVGSPEIKDATPYLNHSEATNRLTGLIKSEKAVKGRVRVAIVDDLVTVREPVIQVGGRSIE